MSAADSKVMGTSIQTMLTMLSCQIISCHNFHACKASINIYEQTRDVFIVHIPHAEVRRQCLIDSNTRLTNVLRKVYLYSRTLDTNQLSAGVRAVSVSIAALKKKTVL